MATSPDATIVLSHGAFAESSSWDSVITRLHDDGLRAIAAANPLRSVSADAADLRALISSIDGPIVLVGHSYGGAVTTNAVSPGDGVEALVYIAAFAPDDGEDIGELSGRLPGSTLGGAVRSVALADGTSDIYIHQDRYHQQFCADVSAATAAIMGATQRPLRDVALAEASGPPAWRSLPSWFVIPELDRNIPPAVQHLMAERAGAVETVEVSGAAHAVSVSNPNIVADMIKAAVEHVRS